MAENGWSAGGGAFFPKKAPQAGHPALGVGRHAKGSKKPASALISVKKPDAQVEREGLTPAVGRPEPGGPPPPVPPYHPICCCLIVTEHPGGMVSHRVGSVAVAQAAVDEAAAQGFPVSVGVETAPVRADNGELLGNLAERLVVRIDRRLTK